jgi:acetylornithine/N-succinyldiaminopimelate aminotransferase
MESKKLKKIMSDDKNYLFQNYGDRLPVSFIKGKNCFLYDQDNKRYIDFFSGIAVSSVGYGNPQFVKALHRQIDSLIHTSNWYYNREQNEAAKLLAELSFPGKTLFANSGTEANEAAIKLSRRFGLAHHKGKYEIVTFTNSFHGRTFGGMSATAQSKIHEGFGPLVPGFRYLPFNDIKSFSKELRKNRNICAVLIELIQGEGGITIADMEFIREVFRICNKNAVLTIIDEVQTGVGRTGAMFAYQHYNIVPDIITLAKGLGGGLPIGAIHAKNFLVDFFPRGSHGSTFGGNHLACAGAAAVLKLVGKKSFLKSINDVGGFIFEKLEQLKQRVDFITDLRGMGLHIGIELTRPGAALVTKALGKGLVINCTAEKVIRIMPPLTINLKTAEAGMKILESIFLEERNKSENSKA